MTRPLLHHISLGVADLAAMAAFYDAVLAPLGVTFQEVVHPPRI